MNGILLSKDDYGFAITEELCTDASSLYLLAEQQQRNLSLVSLFSDLSWKHSSGYNKLKLDKFLTPHSARY